MSSPGPRAVGAVALGGAVGALLRWGLTQLAPVGSGIPWTILAVNVSGSFALAVVLGTRALRQRPVLRAGLGAGVLGGYTTLSAVSEDARALLAGGDVGTALAYLALSAVASVLAVTLGVRVGART